jgi:hypothetical protein
MFNYQNLCFSKIRQIEMKEAWQSRLEGLLNENISPRYRANVNYPLKPMGKGDAIHRFHLDAFKPTL